MNCREFARAWNDRLDALGRGDAPPTPAGMAAHAADCPECRNLEAGFERLGTGLVGLRTTPDRAPRPTPGARGWTVRPGWAVASALVLVAVGAVVAPFGPHRRRSEGPQTAAHRAVTTAGIPPGRVAARVSTPWERAREAVEPVRRVALVGLHDADPARLLPVRLDVSLGIEPPDDLLRIVSDRVTAGVRPLSGSARQAFGFLIGATAANGPPPPVPPRLL